MSYAEKHIAQEALRLERAEAFVDAERRPEIHRQLVGESERTMAVHALNRRNLAMATAAGRIFRNVDCFLSGQSRRDEFPARLFWSCPDDVRWRFCADALRDKRISRATKAQLVAWIMYLPAMNAPGRSEALMQILDEDSSWINVLFPALLGRIEYCHRRLQGWRDVAVSAGEDANPAAYSIRYTWEERFITAEEEAEINRDDGARFALALSLSGHRICKTLLLGLVHSGRWDILKFLYQTFDECWHVLSVEKLLSLLCSNGEIPVEANGLRSVVSRGCHGFIDFLMLKRPDCIANVRDAFGCNLLWQTFYRAQTSHRMGKIYPKIERMLVDCGCDPHETTSLGVSWADVALAQYEAGISVRERDFNLQQGNGNATLDTWFHDLVGARPKGMET